MCCDSSIGSLHSHRRIEICFILEVQIAEDFLFLTEWEVVLRLVFSTEYAVEERTNILKCDIEIFCSTRIFAGLIRPRLIIIPQLRFLRVLYLDLFHLILLTLIEFMLSKVLIDSLFDRLADRFTPWRRWTLTWIVRHSFLKIRWKDLKLNKFQ